jgi:hypothetical protein
VRAEDAENLSRFEELIKAICIFGFNVEEEDLLKLHLSLNGLANKL